MSIFDIYIAYVSWEEGGKSRPVLIFEQKGKWVDVFAITTQYQNKSEAIKQTYFKIEDWQEAGLYKQSYIDTESRFDFPKAILDTKEPVGTLTLKDRKEFLDFLNK